MYFFARKKNPAGWFHSKTKVVNIFPTIPDPIRTKLYLKITIFISNLVRNGSGIFQNMFKTFVLLWRHPAGAFFWPKSAFLEILGMAIFQKCQFSSKTRCLGHLFGEISHKSCSYGPYGPFWFWVKSEF